MGKIKKTFDTEAMYSKIMPSSRLSALNDQSPSIFGMNTKDEEHLSNDQKLSIDQNNKQSEEPDQSDTLINIMEILVREKMTMVMEKMDCCRCEKCRKKIYALALNQLTPKYVVCNEEDLDKEVIKHNGTDSQEATSAVLRSVLEVRKNPPH